MKKLPLPAVLGLAVGAGLLALFVLGLIASGNQGRRPEVGKPAPEVTLTLYEGYRAGLPSTVTLASLRGKPVVLNFWASWCIPCRDEAPAFEAVWRKYRDRVVFLGANYLEVEAAALPYLAQNEITYANGFDLQQQVSRAYRITGVPETFFIDRDGVLRAIEIRPMSVADLEANLQALLK
ncbi:MAG: TlpA family protein disulfide reductase [Thermoflexales bacterium]|nr:TlpA family protein disulfide reductase [Thermoflexales bacterium]